MQSMNRLAKLFRPRSIAVVGGGTWCRSVLQQCIKFGFTGDLWPVYPKASKLVGMKTFPTIAELPGPPDAAFVGVNRDATIESVQMLSALNSGGCVCFASGFREAEAQLPGSASFDVRLKIAAGDMPILGPNCYGFINALDQALLWPDQHGLTLVNSGVAIVTQSSNIAINLTMQRRALPIAFIATAGNQTIVGSSEIALEMLADERVTALGLHVEGFGDLRALESLAECSRKLGKPVVVLKAGKSRQARKTAVSHTASLAGEDAGAQALIDRLGFARVSSLPAFLETLKLLHVVGPLKSNRIASVSCSGGEASLIADSALGRNVEFPQLNARQMEDLGSALGDRVALANPLDYHTYIWRDADAMTRAWSAIVDPSLALTIMIVDFPRNDRCDTSDWDCAIQAAIATRQGTGGNIAMVATLAELMPESVAERLISGKVVPLSGLDEALEAVEAAVAVDCTGNRLTPPRPVTLPGNPGIARIVDEFSAKTSLAEFGMPIPRMKPATSPESAAQAAEEIGYPVVLKALGLSHKTEAGAVHLNLNDPEDVIRAGRRMNAEEFLVEEMIPGSVAELLVGVIHDAAHGYVLTVGAGGTLAELVEDRTSLLIPANEEEIRNAIGKLRVSCLLSGWRGGSPANMSSIVHAVRSLQDFVIANREGLVEVEINPLLCLTDKAFAADALLRRAS